MVPNFFFNLGVFIKEYPQQEEQETLKSKDTRFAAVKLPKCLEGPHSTYDRFTNSSRL